MITILNGKLTIPENERFIGFAGDNLARTIKFLVADETSAQSVYRLYLTFDDGTVNYFVLPSKVTPEGVMLTWNVLFEHIFKNGIVKAQIKAFLDEDVVYHTNADTFIVGDSPEFADYLRTQSTEFLEYEKTLNEIYKSIRDGILTEELIGDNSVTSEKLADNAVTTEKLADNAVTSDKIKDGAVTPNELDRMYWECIYLMQGLTNAAKEYTSAQINRILANEEFNYNPARTLFYAWSDGTWETNNAGTLPRGLYIGVADVGQNGVYFTHTESGNVYYYSRSNGSIIFNCPYDIYLDSNSMNAVRNDTVTRAIDYVKDRINLVAADLTQVKRYRGISTASQRTSMSDVVDLAVECDLNVLYVFDLADDKNTWAGSGRCAGFKASMGDGAYIFEFVNLSKGGIWRLNLNLVYEDDEDDVGYLVPNGEFTRISKNYITEDDVDPTLSTTSKKPVQNKVVTSNIDRIANEINKIYSNLNDVNTTLNGLETFLASI